MGSQGSKTPVSEHQSICSSTASDLRLYGIACVLQSDLLHVRAGFLATREQQVSSGNLRCWVLLGCGVGFPAPTGRHRHCCGLRWWQEGQSYLRAGTFFAAEAADLKFCQLQLQYLLCMHSDWYINSASSTVSLAYSRVLLMTDQQRISA